ncbi:MAG: DUF4123 domain-containing protein [Pseudaminobacter sp.]|nr:DUF4123 domain-containing protein [Pseudaminobacter sp.]
MTSPQGGQAKTLYAIVDAARDQRLYPLVMHATEKACLFAGDIAEPLARAAPHLVNLRSNEQLFHAWRDTGRGQAWGVLCRSDLPLDALRRHLRRFLVAKLPDGMVVQFRFYDPRVFNAYLRECNAEELARWFKGVSCYLVEDGQTGAMHEYNLRGGLLHDGDERLGLEPEGEVISVSKPSHKRR